MSSHNDSFAASDSSPTYDFIGENNAAIFVLQSLPPDGLVRHASFRLAPNSRRANEPMAVDVEPIPALGVLGVSR